MPSFKPNYPRPSSGKYRLLSTPERTGAAIEFTGRGVVMAFIDAGYYPHPDLAGRILVYTDASTNHIIEHTRGFDCGDMGWHGQMTTVIAAGDGSLSDGLYRGIAPEVKLVLVRVSTPQGQVKETDILRGLRWLIDTHRRFNVRIVNISVGGDFVSRDPAHPLHAAVRKLVHAGVTVVVAAGNRHVAHLLPPASSPEAITVGGLDDHNTLNRARWTLYHHNYGKAYDGTPKPDLIAPAQWIASPIMPGTGVEREAGWLAPLLKPRHDGHLRRLLKNGYADLGLTHNLKADEKLFAVLQNRINKHKIVDATHQHVDGTSVSAPIVSAVIAQMLEASPGLTPAQIRAILTATAVPLPGYPPEQQGAGVLNAATAVQRAATQ